MGCSFGRKFYKDQQVKKLDRLYRIEIPKKEAELQDTWVFRQSRASDKTWLSKIMMME